MRVVRKKKRHWLGRIPLWAKAAFVLLVPLCALNASVAWLGSTHVALLSPYHLHDKARAVGAYLVHRPFCVFSGHDDLQKEVDAASRRHRLPSGLLAAVVAVESGGIAHRISPAGAMGPGQLMPDTARLMKVDDPYEPREALDGSARYLAKQLHRYGDVRLALAAYNAGPGNVHRRVPRNGETEFYVDRVMAEYAKRRPTRGQRSRPRGR